MSGKLVSLIIPARNEGLNVINTLNSIFQCRNATPFELIVVDDGSEDGCCHFLRKPDRPKNIKLVNTGGVGSARARNAGAASAAGDILIFCDAHIFVEDNWIDRLVESIDSGRVDAVCPAIAPHDRSNDLAGGFTWDDSLRFIWLPRPPKLSPVPLLPGGCMAVRAGVFFNVEGFDRGFIVWGREDEEISLKMWLFGYTLGVNPDVKVRHVFRQRHPYTVSWDHVDYNLLRMAYSHFKGERILKAAGLIKHHPNSRRIEQQVLAGDVAKQRLRYFSRRKRDDDWFFKRFRISF